MPLSLFSPSRAKEIIVRKIEDSKKLIADIEGLEKERFLQCLAARISDFESELLNDHLNPQEKYQVMEQYNRFSKTLHLCLKRPHETESYVNYYHRHTYYPVGIHDVEKPNPLWKQLAMGGVVFGIGLLLFSIPSFIANPIIGSIVLATAFTILFPSCFYLLAPESPDTNKKKDEEKELFQQGARLIQPNLCFEEDSTPISDSMTDINPTFVIGS